MKTKLNIILVMLFIALNGYSQDLVTLSGVVNDSLYSTPIEGVSVFIASLAMGTVTNEKGQFMLYVPKGKYEVVFSVTGYESHTLNLEISGDESKEIELKAEPRKGNVINRLLNRITESPANVIAQAKPQQKLEY